RDIEEDPYGVPGVDYPFNDDLGFETDVATIEAGINSITLGAGADWRESVYSGLMHCIDGNSLGGWRNEPDVARAIILIGDAPPHEPEPTTGYTLDGVIAAATAGAPKKIFAIPVDGHPTTTGYFTSLAEGTGGAVPEAADATEVVDAVMEAISLVWRPPLSIYIEEDCKLNWWNTDSNSWELDSHNIGEDPLFIAGYYLSQIASGQVVDSPCVDAGYADANHPDISLDTHTTRTDGVYDVNMVDMGYHYTQGLIQYRLTVTVIEDPNDPGIHGYVDPNIAVAYKGFGDNVITLTAVPDAGYKVKRWTGTDDDTSTSRINLVTVTEDKNITVEFEPAPLYNFFAIVIDRGDGPHGIIEPNSGAFFDGTIIPMTATPDPNYEVRMWYGTDDDTSRDPNNVVTVLGTDVFVAVEFGPVGQNIINLYNSLGVLDRRSPFSTIQAAIDAAEPNSTVVLSDGVYKGTGNYNLNLRAGLDANDVRPITVRSENGSENCIIDAEGLGRLFIFDSNEDPNSYIVDGLTLTGGSAGFGGAILINSASPTITNSKIINNNATGNGGGIYITNSSPIISNTEISNNTAGGFGGGIYGEAGATAEIINCLITFNTSGDIGGAIYLFNSDAIINLSTIAFNYGLDYNEEIYPNPKGGIAARDSSPTITNCIIGRNGNTFSGISGMLFGTWGDLFSSGDDLYNCEATFSDIENGDDVGTNGNIDDDPLWVTGGLGSFYLSQITSGQPQTSPAVNAGEQYILATLQATYNLGNITTSILNANDVGFADMGYHYPFFTGPPIEYSLQVFVVGNGSLEYTDANGVLITVEPNQLPEVHYFIPGESVTLKAIPDPGDPGYRVSKWTGTDDDTSVVVINTVNMYSNRTVFIEFEPNVPRVLNVSTDGQYTYLGIQDAIDDAKDGDIVVLHSGIYAGTGFTVIGKNITITGTNPDDPNAVASTVIDCTGEIEGGIHIVGAPGGTTILNGITIMNSNVTALNALPPQDPGDRGNDGGENLPYAFMDTTLEGNYTGSGTISSNSAITVFGNHIISNCIVRDCSLTGGNASGGNAGDQDGMDGGDGGWGGSSAGAGLYIGDIYDYYYDYTGDINDPNYLIGYEPTLINWGGSPTIINCTFDNCAAIAGNGANGGNGANFATGGTGGLSGRALGGGIFCGPGTSPTFTNCTITNCSVSAANGGNGG
ncbi:MAG: InlB B-repeat-containing protein, partial [Planctomycetota bacterium]